MSRREVIALFVMVLAMLAIIITWYQLGVFVAMFALLGWYVVTVPLALIVAAFIAVWKH